jgi:hypothetical protein
VIDCHGRPRKGLPPLEIPADAMACIAPASFACRGRAAEKIVEKRCSVSQAANERYLEALAGVAETKTVKEFAEPVCRRASEPGQKSSRKVRALNPLASDDLALLRAISDPKCMVNGLRNRDLVAVLYPTATDDPNERRRRSGRVTRLLRLLRGHSLLQKVPRTHLYQVTAQARTTILALLAAADANPAKLTSDAA